MSNGQSLLLFIPFVIALAVFVFRLDEQVSAPKSAKDKPIRRFCRVDTSGKIILTDPDGRESGTRRKKT